MNKKPYDKSKQPKGPQVGQGFNDARGEIPDKKDIPKNNGLNVNNDPQHIKEKEAEKKRP